MKTPEIAYASGSSQNLARMAAALPAQQPLRYVPKTLFGTAESSTADLHVR